MVKIDIEMPKSCSDCGFSSFDRDDWNCYCEFLDLEINYQERLENCPLMEEKE